MSELSTSEHLAQPEISHFQVALGSEEEVARFEITGEAGGGCGRGRSIRGGEGAQLVEGEKGQLREVKMAGSEEDGELRRQPAATGA